MHNGSMKTTKNETAIERIKATLVAFAGCGLSAKQVAAEAGCSVSWVYRVLKRLEAEGFVAYTHRDAQGLPTRERRYAVASRDVLEDHLEAEHAAELVLLEEAADLDVEDEYMRWAAAA